MKTLDRYIGRSLLRSFALIIFILAAIFSFIELVAQLGDVGEGNYKLVDAVIFIGLTMPRRLLDLMPVSTLLGSIVGLGLLADNRELLAMQAGGVSVRRICLSVFATGSLLMLTTGVLAEIIVPPTELQARTLRSRALSITDITLTKSGFWARRGFSYIQVGKMLDAGMATDIEIFECDEQGHLISYTFAREAGIQSNRQWLLKEVTLKSISEQGITTSQQPSLMMNSFLSSNQVSVLKLPPDSLSFTDLYEYIQALRGSGQNADRYALALWRKMSVPLTTGAMILLSLPFIFRSDRSTTAGRRIMMGSFVAIALYFSDQVIVHLGLLLNLSPIITAMTPVVLISSFAFWRLQGKI